MKKFTLGAIVGASSLALAVPLIAQMASAQSASGQSWGNKPVPSQACIQALADYEATMLSSFDSLNAQRKTIIQTHHDALVAAAAIVDETQRKDALKTAEQTKRDAMKKLMDGQNASDTITAIKNACGNAMPFGKGMMGDMGMGFHGMMGFRGPMGADLAEKLGMTEDQLKTELDSGKTIEQIAQEHGVTLPAKRGMGMKRHGWNNQDAEIVNDSK